MKAHKNKKSLFLFLLVVLMGCNNGIDEQKLETNAIEISLVKNESVLEKYFPYIKDTLSLIAIFIGIYITYPLLKKKLVENHIANTLQNIQDTNTKIQNDCQKLIDEYIPLTYSSKFLRESEIESVYEQLKKLYHDSQQASSDVLTILYYLKNTLQGTLKHYEYGKYTIITSRDLYGLIISILELTIFYCSKIVQIPKSVKTQERTITNPKLKKFITNSKSAHYKYFNQGLINDVKTSHLGFFYEEVNRRNHALIKRAAFRIFQDPAPIATLLYLGEIYAPLVLDAEHDVPLDPNGRLRLFLIGFSFRNKLTMKDGTIKKVINLDYSNPDDFGRFANDLKIDDFKTNFRDTYIKESKFKFDKITMIHSDFETITIQIETDYLKSKFKKVKRSMVKQMKKDWSSTSR